MRVGVVCQPLFVIFKPHRGMDSELYDEFGNYIGPELESDESDEGEDQGKDDMPVLLG